VSEGWIGCHAGDDRTNPDGALTIGGLNGLNGLKSFTSEEIGRVQQRLGVTPVMEAGVSDHVWSLEEVIAPLN
jgi:hypothetical protein